MNYQTLCEALNEISIQRKIVHYQNLYNRTRNPIYSTKVARLRKQLKASREAKTSDISQIQAIDPRAIRQK